MTIIAKPYYSDPIIYNYRGQWSANLIIKRMYYYDCKVWGGGGRKRVAERLLCSLLLSRPPPLYSACCVQPFLYLFCDYIFEIVCVPTVLGQ